MENSKIKLNIVLVQNKESKKYTGYFVEFPDIIADGLTRTETEKNLIELLNVYLEYKVDQLSAPMIETANSIHKTINFNYETA
jgi:predicted RNase H-like HicB family nuclease